MTLVRLLCFEVAVPSSILKRITDGMVGSATNLFVTAESATFRFSRGLTMRRLRVFNRAVHPMSEDRHGHLVMSASRVDLDLDLLRLPWSSRTMLRGVTLEDFHYPRLPEGYYIPDSIEKPGTPDFVEVNEPLWLDLPNMRPFSLTLVRPDVLGVTPRSVEIPEVHVTQSGIRAEGIGLRWADPGLQKKLEGALEFDLDAQKVVGNVEGLVCQHHVEPMLHALDITNAFPFIQAFTDIERPVQAGCRYDVNLRNNDLHLLLDLHPRGGRHHGVPLKQVDGTVDIRVFVRDTYQNADIHVDIGRAEFADGSYLAGGVRYVNTNDVGHVEFDAVSQTSISNVLAVADVMRDGELDTLCVTGLPPRVALKGCLAVRPDLTPELNDLTGSLEFETGSLLSVPLRKVRTRFGVKGSAITFSGAEAQSRNGGGISGDGSIVFRSCWEQPAYFNANVACTNVPLSDFAEVFGRDVGVRHGWMDGRASLMSPLGTNALDRLSGSGRVVLRDGCFAQLKILDGLLEFLSKRTGGVLGLGEAPTIDFADVRSDFTISNGVFRTQNLVAEGRVLSIQAVGAYDMRADRLDCSVRVRLLKWDLGGLARPLTMLSTSLLDFKVEGPLDNPSWTYSNNPLRLLPPLDILPMGRKKGGESPKR